MMGGVAGARRHKPTSALICCVPTPADPHRCPPADYTAALGIDPRNAYAFYNRGISHDRSGDYEAAIGDFSSAIALLPSNADFYHNRGFCHRCVRM